MFKTVDDFLNHRGSDGGGGAKRLKSWAKDKGFLNFFLHVAALPTAIWYHRLPELVIRTDKDDPSKTLRNVWGRQQACWEDESILKKQRFRTQDGHREHPPKLCGLCRLPEAAREMILSGEIKDTDVLFEFNGSDKPEENCVLHAGGLCNFWKREMPKEEVERLNAHGVYQSKSWAENVVAKLNYIFAGVDFDNVSAGLQIAIQTQLVGDKVKKCINDEIARFDGDKGNPFINPYCIQLLYKPEEKKFDDKYHARAVAKPMSPEIERLIRSEKPDISKFTQKFNQKTVRAMLETHATAIGKKLPWDAIFDVPCHVPSDGEEVKAQVQAQVQVPVEVGSKAPLPVPPNAVALAEEWDDPCEDCKAPMKKGQTKCGKCGAVYSDTPASPAAASAAAAASSEADLYDDQDVPF